MNILTTTDLSISIGSITVCEDLNLSIESGQCVGILGKNGVGKTTLLHTLLNFLPAKSGVIKLNNRPITDWSRKDIATHVGILFQDNTESMPASVLETALLGRHPYMGNWRWESEEDVALAKTELANTGLLELQEREVSTLSGGEIQRLAIARLLVQNPKLYLLDEPSNHLDISYQIKTLSLLKQTAANNTASLCMATHDINLAARFCDRILLLIGDGEFILGECEEVLTAKNLQHAYGCVIKTLSKAGTNYYFPA